MNNSEQRWANRPPLSDFSVPMQNLLTADKQQYADPTTTTSDTAGFFNAVLGRKYTDLQITLGVGGTTYSNLTLMSDDLTQTNHNNQIYNQQIRLRQVSNASWAPASLTFNNVAVVGSAATYTYTASTGIPTTGMYVTVTGFGSSGNNVTNALITSVNLGLSKVTVTTSTQSNQSGTATGILTPGVYPTLSFGTNAEQPFTQVYRFLTSVNDSPYGPRYVYQWYESGLSGFPTIYQRGWRLSYPLITQADASTLENFFNCAQGRYMSFTFVDPIDGLTYPHVRFDADSIQFKYITVNQLSTELVLIQTNGS